MSTNDTRQGRKDAENGKPARDTQNDHWKGRQDYNAAHAAEKNKRG